MVIDLEPLFFPFVNFKKFGEKIFHVGSIKPIIPVFQHSNWGETPNFFTIIQIIIMSLVIALSIRYHLENCLLTGEYHSNDRVQPRRFRNRPETM